MFLQRPLTDNAHTIHDAGLWTSSKLLVIILVIMFLSHVIACGWYQIGVKDQLLQTTDGAYSVQVPGWVSGQFLPTYGCGSSGCGVGGGDASTGVINRTDGFATEEMFQWHHAYIDAYCEFLRLVKVWHLATVMCC